MERQEKDYSVEFKAICKLEGPSKNYFRIPDEIIYNCELGKIRIALYAYLYIHKGINDIVNFSVPLFLNWAGLKSDSHSGGMNDKVLTAMELLSDMGYVCFVGDKKLTRTSCAEIQFNTQLVHNMCCSGDRFAIVYLDEVESIMRYKNEKKSDTHFNSFSILLVFVYLRRSIIRRKNKLNPEERSEERIKDRRMRIPEAYNGKYKDIAFELGISERIVSKSVEILRRLKLIVVGVPYRIRGIDGEYRTPDFLFSNFQKRDEGQLLISGIEYAKTEINLKAKQMHDYHKKFGVNYSLKEIS